MIKDSFVDAFKSSEFLNIINGSAGQAVISPVIRNLEERLGLIQEEDIAANTESNTKTSITPVNIKKPSECLLQIDSEIIYDMEEKVRNIAAIKIKASKNQKLKGEIIVEKQNDEEFI